MPEDISGMNVLSYSLCDEPVGRDFLLICFNAINSTLTVV